MATMQRVEGISNTLPAREPLFGCEVSKTTLCALKILGIILVGAGAVIGFVAGFQASAIALLITGAVALIFGFILHAPADIPLRLSEALMAKIRAVPPAPHTEEAHLELSMLGATSGLLIGDAMVGPSKISEIAMLVARIVEEQRQHPDRSLASLFEEQLPEPTGQLEPPGAEVGISVVGVIYYADLAAVVEKSVLFTRACYSSGPAYISVVVALSVAVALLLRGRSIDEVTLHASEIAKQVFLDEKGPMGQDDPDDRLLLENLEPCIRGERLPHPAYRSFGLFHCLRCAFAALREAEIDTPSAGVQRWVVMERGANAAAAGALLGAYLGNVALRDVEAELNLPSSASIRQHSALVARLSGAFPQAV